MLDLETEDQREKRKPVRNWERQVEDDCIRVVLWKKNRLYGSGNELKNLVGI